LIFFVSDLIFDNGALLQELNVGKERNAFVITGIVVSSLLWAE